MAALIGLVVGALIGGWIGGSGAASFGGLIGFVIGVIVISRRERKARLQPDPAVQDGADAVRTGRDAALAHRVAVLERRLADVEQLLGVRGAVAPAGPVDIVPAPELPKRPGAAPTSATD